MLFVVGTPIGNLDDLSYRASKILLSVPLILAEDTRAFAHLVDHASKQSHLPRNPDQHVWSYYKDVEFQKIPEIVHLLEEGNDIALVSEAGMPVVSDPGQLLIQTVRNKRLPYTVIPGPTAAETGLVISGIKHRHHFFVGFFPKKNGERQTLLERLHQTHMVIDETVFVAYESPIRLVATVTLILEMYPHTEVYIARELTKMHEELLLVTLPLDDNIPHLKGECVIVWRFV